MNHPGPPPQPMADASATDAASVEAAVRQWIERAVIGLNLCPFAKAVLAKRQLRIVVSDASDEAALLQHLAEELLHLQKTPAADIDTTVLVHPRVLGDFLDYNDFLDVADALLQQLQLQGEIQIASFHPQYRFAGSGADDVENLSNRAPWPLLHLLREDSVARAVAAYPDPDVIVQRNLTTLRRLGHDGFARVLAGEDVQTGSGPLPPSS